MESTNQLVSVVVPTHNRKTLLKETIESILKQSYSNLELIVVSDGSNDGTNKMVSEINDARVRLIEHAQSGQPAKPRNAGIVAAKGSYIALCDDDDLWEPNKLEIQVKALENDTAIGMCYTNGRVLKEGVIQQGILNRRKIFKNHFQQLLYGNFIPNSSVLIRKTIISTAGMINTNTIFRGIEDYEYWLRLSHAFQIEYIDEPLIQYRVHNSNITYSRSLETERAIKVIKHINNNLEVPHMLFIKTLFFQYAKYWIYKLLLK
jgi:glycosyltransferase involved in cell wall biosynthesis